MARDPARSIFSKVVSFSAACTLNFGGYGFAVICFFLFDVYTVDCDFFVKPVVLPLPQDGSGAVRHGRGRGWTWIAGLYPETTSPTFVRVYPEATSPTSGKVSHGRSREFLFF